MVLFKSTLKMNFVPYVESLMSCKTREAMMCFHVKLMFWSASL